ncbi:methyltransferase [Proteinivorax hydrogeniformans]|uniref:Methyltransferase n=1 Tax=Proteinivorax hydrogeniformans TaxID=1826727 RepID=A0AAU8HTQ6_9FIRM
MSAIKSKNIRVDDLQRKDLKIVQDPNLYMFTMDAVLLSHYATVKNNCKAIDLGTGTGVIPLLMSARGKFSIIFAVEIQKQLASLVKKSVQLNKLNHLIKVVNEDIMKGLPGIPKNYFDLVTINPPYLKYDKNIEKTSKNIGKRELCGDLEGFISITGKLLKVGGKVAMVQSAHRLADTLELLKKYKLEPKRFRLVQPNLEKEPTVFLVEAIKGAKPGLKVNKTLIINKNDKEYTQEVSNLYFGEGGLL